MALSLSATPAAVAQVTGSIEAAVSRVHYDDFVPSAAASLGAAYGVQGRRAALSTRASYLLFESGNATWQAALAGAYFTPRVGPSRPELWAAAGGSRYAYLPGFWHAIGGARFHFAIERGTVWVDGSLGTTSFGGSPQPVSMMGAGVWTRRYGPTVTLATSYVQVGDTSYTDIQATARARRGSTEIDGVAGTRLWSSGGGRGVYGEVIVAVPLGGRASLVVSGGRYPTDPWRGTISGRYASAGIRIRTVAPANRAPQGAPGPVLAASASSASGENRIIASLAVRPQSKGVSRLVIHAPGAVAVDVMGDFTDWQPLAL
ncbi:MAG TPA: hypothetical protein VFX28_09585, partial [Methylomirabilota bacterium]|nr:hypothetical protein [Methylomirabilota bacterium]